MEPTKHSTTQGGTIPEPQIVKHPFRRHVICPVSTCKEHLTSVEEYKKHFVDKAKEESKE